MTLRPQERAGDREFEALYRQNLELRRQVDHLATLREIGLAISGSLEKDETMRLIASVVQGALEIRRLTIYEADKENDTPVPRVTLLGSGVEKLELSRCRTAIFNSFEVLVALTTLMNVE